MSLKRPSKASKKTAHHAKLPDLAFKFSKAKDECSAEFRHIWGVPSGFRSWGMDCYQSFSTSASQSVTRPLAFRARGNEKGKRPTLGWNVGMAPSITTKLQPNPCNLFPPICTSPAAIRPRKGETAKTKTWLWQLKTFFCAPVSMSQTVTFQSFPEKMSSRCWWREHWGVNNENTRHWWWSREREKCYDSRKFKSMSSEAISYISRALHGLQGIQWCFAPKPALSGALNAASPVRKVRPMVPRSVAGISFRITSPLCMCGISVM